VAIGLSEVPVGAMLVGRLASGPEEFVLYSSAGRSTPVSGESFLQWNVDPRILAASPTLVLTLRGGAGPARVRVLGALVAYR
jgi:hypothetical protein